MLNDIIEHIGYEKILKTIENDYKLEDGIYIKLNVKKSIEDNEILLVNNKKDKEIEKIELYNWFKQRDVYSKYLNSSKAIVQKNKGLKSPKVIISCNSNSVFVNVPTITKNLKRENMEFNDYCKVCVKEYYDALEIKIIEKYNKLIKSVKKRKQKKEELLNKYFKNEIDMLNSTKRQQRLKRNREYLLKNLDSLIDILKQQNRADKQKVKIFIEDDVIEYKKEYEIYLYPNLFAENKYNIVENEQIQGIHSNNMTLNSGKKPFLSLRNCKTLIPTAVTLKEAIKLNNLYKYLKISDKNLLLNNGKNMMDVLLFSDKNTPLTIVKYDNIPHTKTDKINFTIKNILQIKNEKGFIRNDDKNIKEKWQLEKKFNEYFFNGRMKGNYRTLERKDLKYEKGNFTSKMQTILIMHKNFLWDYFKNDINTNVYNTFNKITETLLKEKIQNTDLTNYKVKEIFNFRISLLEFLNGGNDMSNKLNEILENLSQNNYAISNDDEYYFMTGQIVYYLVSNSKAQEKTLDLFKSFLQINNDKVLKNKVRGLIRYYSHVINLYNIEFKNVQSQLSVYKTKTLKITSENEDMLLSGFLADNIFYKKNER